jgi:phage gpG-like protein
MSEMIQISISTEGEEAIVRDFANRWGRGKNLRPVFEKFRNYYRAEIDDNFKARGGAFGNWQRRKKSYPHSILEKTGRMRKGFTSTISTDELVFRNSRSYFRFHQLGTRKMPARKMWGVRQKDSNELMQRLQKYLMKGEL